MAEIVDLNDARVKRDGAEVIEVSMWTCRCDNSEFHLFEGGAVICTNCMAQQANVEHICIKME